MTSQCEDCLVLFVISFTYRIETSMRYPCMHNALLYLLFVMLIVFNSNYKLRTSLSKYKNVRFKEIEK